MKFDLIAFDADDTLWQTELFYRQAEDNFLHILAAYEIRKEEILPLFHRIEVDNLIYFGYGIRGFILSLIETGIQVTNGQIRGTDIQAMILLGKEMTSHEIILLDGAEEALTGLQKERLIIVTKGDMLDQENKIARSGLKKYFSACEIVVDKTQEIYQNILQKYQIPPSRFVMVGNSLRSDISPVLALGGYAVYVPSPLTWEHESEADLPPHNGRLVQIETLRELPQAIRQFDRP